MSAVAVPAKEEACLESISLTAGQLAGKPPFSNSLRRYTTIVYPYFFNDTQLDAALFKPLRHFPLDFLDFP